MAWTDAARAASLAVRRAHAKGRYVTLYHGTTATAAAKIAREGFRPSGRSYSREYYSDARQTGSFFAKRSYDARRWAVDIGGRRWWAGDPRNTMLAVVKVRIPPKKRIWRDRIISGGRIVRGVSAARVASIDFWDTRGHMHHMWKRR